MCNLLKLLIIYKVAIKILEKSKIVEVADMQRIEREIKILKKIRHTHIV